MSELSRSVGSKRMYKAMLFVLKYIPTILAIANIVSLALQFFGFPIFGLIHLFGTSFLFIGLLYILSYVFRFCYLYRLPLHYVAIINSLSIIDFYIGLPFTSVVMYQIYSFITGLAMLTYIYLVIKNSNTPKAKTNIFKIYRWFGCGNYPQTMDE